MKFYKKLSDKLIFSWVKKNPKLFYFTCLTGQVLKKQGDIGTRKMKEKTKTSNLIVDHFSLNFVNLSLA